MFWEKYWKGEQKQWNSAVERLLERFKFWVTVNFCKDTRLVFLVYKSRDARLVHYFNEEIDEFLKALKLNNSS